MQESIDHVHVISLDPPVRLDEKPPDYASVMDVPPPCYDDAIKLDPQRLIADTENNRPRAVADSCAVALPDECDKTDSRSTVPPQTTVVNVMDAATAEHHQMQPSTTLAQAIRKSIRDIRRQLTNTVNDTSAEVEQQQNGSEHHNTTCCADNDNIDPFKPETRTY